MMSNRRSHVVESRVEQAILDVESRRNAAFTSESEQPRRASPWGDARTSDNDSVCRAGLSIDELGDLSIDQAQTSKSISSGSEFEISRMTLPRSRLMRALRLCAPRMRR